MRLKDSRVVIIGGTSGFGAAAAHAAAAEGAAVIVASRRAGRIAETGAGAGSIAGEQIDARRPEDLAALFQRVGPFDHLIYTAGESLLLGELAATDLEAARRFFDVRLWGAMAAARAAAPAIRAGGSITLASGIASTRPLPGWSIVATVLAAVEGLTRALAVELAPLRVNAVRAGVARTALWDDMDPEARTAMYDGVGAGLPVGRVGQAKEIADALLFLACNRFVTGEILTVDGGALVG